MEISEGTLRKIIQEQQERAERHLGALKEDFDHKLEAVLEYVKDIPNIKEKQDSMEERQNRMEGKQDVMFEQIGRITEDVSVIKETIQSHERRLQSVK